MANPKFRKGAVFVDGRSANKQTGANNVTDFLAALEELTVCDGCGCNDCLAFETIRCATTGELLVRYYTGALGGPYTEVIEDYDTGIANIQALYEARA